MTSVDLSFEKLYDALIRFKEIYGNTRVPYKFSVPVSPEWKTELHGYKLGAVVSRIRNRGDFKSYEEVLKKMEFQYSSEINLRFEMIFEALVVYKEKFGHLYVPKSFVVPSFAENKLDNMSFSSNTTWPLHLRGLKLGNRVDNIRNKKSFRSSPEFAERLDKLGFIWEHLRDTRNITYVLQALQIYRNCHGHIAVPRSFVVPSTLDWPSTLHGMKLGAKVSHIRNRGDHSEYRADFDALGFKWDAFRDREFISVFNALADFNNFGVIPPDWTE